MSALNMTSPNTDYDAAQALLDLQGTLNQENGKPYLWSTDNNGDMNSTAALLWNCFASSKVPNANVPNSNHHETSAKAIITTAENRRISSSFEKYSKHLKTTNLNDKLSLRYQNHQRKNLKITDEHNITKSPQKLGRLKTLTDMKVNHANVDTLHRTKTKTREIGTQTEERYFNPNMELMEMTIKNLCERIQSLEAQLKDLSVENSGYISSENDENIDAKSHESENNDCNMSSNADSKIESKNSKHMKYSQKMELERCQDHIGTHEQNQNDVLRTRVISNHNMYSNSSDLVPIGDGHASVPARLLKHINWNSYTGATRKLLTAVFSRRILATHSLTGKPSPAFPNKPAKKKLNPAIVNDIVQTVVERCSVPENVVRTSITTKCADESKMFRTRQNNKNRRTSKKNRENIPPTTSESESDSYY